jgi:MATE family multidrug resistance protein
VFAIAGPAMLANLTTPLLGIVATSAIGRLGEAALLGGVAMAAVAFDGLFWLFGFLRMGTVAFTAQSLGAGDAVEIRAVLARALLLALASGVLLIALQVPLGHLVFALMGGSEAVSAAAKSYFTVRVWSAPFALANYALLGWFVGQARARIALGLQIAINTVNIAGNLLLVTALKLGITGAAFAAIIAETSGCAIGLFAAFRLAGGRLDGVAAVLFDRSKLARMLAVNRDIMIRTAMLIAAFFFFTAQGARTGDVTLAANTVLYNFIMIGSFFLDGLANSAEQLCGQSIGARDGAAFARSARLVLAWAAGFGIVLTLLFFAAGTPLIELMTTNAEVREAARKFLPFAALAPACGVMAYCFDGIFIGATWAREMRNLMIAALLLYLAAWYALAPLGNTGLWLALLIFLMARGLLQASRFPALAKRTFAA